MNRLMPSVTGRNESGGHLQPFPKERAGHDDVRPGEFCDLDAGRAVLMFQAWKTLTGCGAFSSASVRTGDERQDGRR
jgi:hypothetical protein